MVDISVIVASYYPDITKLYATLKSIIKQKNITFEIIIADDGSVDNYFTELDGWFKKINFNNYILVSHQTNQGTCKNIYDALLKATGKYVKTISPGDYLFDENTLYKWVQFMRNNSAVISFGNLINFHKDNMGKVVLDKVLEKPQLIFEYDKGNINGIKISYLLLYDIPVGATFMVKTEILKKYLMFIIGKVVYAEDFAIKLMVLDNIRIFHYNENVIWYEFGTGISTSKEIKWKEMLAKDLDAIKKIIIDEYIEKDFFSKKYKKFLKSEKIYGRKLSSILKYIYFPEAIFINLKKKRLSNYVKTNIDVNLINRIIN